MVPLLVTLHALAAVFWVGGMAFAYFVLRPAAGPLEGAARLALWRRTLAGFLPQAGIAAAVLLATGIGIVFGAYGGFGAVPTHVNLMMTTGIIMMLIYLHLVYAPWRRFRQAVDAGKAEDAARALEQIRMIVGINLALGVLTVVFATGGRYYAM
jgi:uncharacterized membrane protein